MCCHSCNGSEEPFFNKTILGLTRQGLRTVTIFPWPAQSPHLSPMEHIWDHLRRRVGHSMSLNELEAMLQQIWNEMSQDIIQNLYASIPDRITSCIRARRGSTSYGHHNKTSLYFNNWHNNQRLKRNSPFSYADHLQLPSSHIEPHYLKSCLSPSEGLPRVHFHFNMSTPVTKKDLIADHLRQLALESINEIPCDAIKIYTDGSRLDDRAGSGIYIENSGQNFYFCHRNPDFSSVFKSELTAIKLGLEAIINESDYGELWILSDSRSSLQHLHNWTQVGDKTSISILHNLKLISKHHDVHFQWIPSYVDIFGNEQADRLAREGCSPLTTSSPAITYSEHQSKINRQLSKERKIPPSHHWYAAREPGSFLDLNCDRASKTAISRLASGHMKSLSFFEGRKTFKFCSKCKVQQASSEHILDCLGLSREDLHDSPLLVIDFLRVNNLMDLV
ncbi:RNase H domain-containing protein [Trichonephila clavipes]|nr:RNase H domain-containing protein [Trichonephila clavipes]